MRKKVMILPIAALLVALVTGGVASAGASKVQIIGQEQFVANALVNSTFHFAPGPIMVASGGTITFENTVNDIHTVSVVNQSDLPTSIDQVFNCSICNVILAGHFGTNPPTVWLNQGGAGFDTAGDSVLIAPVGAPGSTVTITVTARPGTTLQYMCAIHPWMQGTIQVK